MKIEFLRQASDPNSYTILENNAAIFTATYNPRSDEKALYTLANDLVAKGFTHYTNKIQFIGDYLIQLMEGKYSEVLIKTKSFFFNTKKFSFEGLDYTIMPHIGTKFSMYKEKKQAAAYQTYDYGTGSTRMTLICDDNLPKTLFCLISLYLYSDFGNERAIPNTPVNIWFQGKRNNENWKPNSSY